MSLQEEFRARRSTSEKLFLRAKGLFPSGVTHDGRYFEPFPVYVVRAQGSRKWDADGNEYIDYWVGHGALLLGHGNSKVVQAVTEQIRKGTHYGASHELEIRWGELVQRLVPSAQRIRFHASGTEATLMALRLARAYTGKAKIVKLRYHFHGWQDYLTPEMPGAYNTPKPVGVPQETLSTVLVAPSDDSSAIAALLNGRDDIAGVIVEPSGGHMGAIPIPLGFLRELRDLTHRRRILLIFDEVVTGFRWSPGGAQVRFGIEPDITTLAKILAGGLPGGAVAGKRDVLERLEFKDADWNRTQRIPHPGTFNANPLSAAAGVVALEQVATGVPTRQAEEIASLLRSELNQVLKRHELAGAVYGEASIFHILVGAELPPFKEGEGLQGVVSPATFNAGMGPKGAALRMSMLVNGVDLMRTTGIVSAAHTELDAEETVKAFDKSLAMLKKEGVF